MGKRLALGLLKGLIIGGVVGAALQYGLGWTSAAGLLGYLVAMGAAGTTGVFAGKPPWLEGAWIEAVLKGVAGVGVGALAYWLGSSYAAFAIPFPGLPAAQAWTSLPVVYAPLMAGFYGALVELDNTPRDEGAGKGKKKGPKTRVAVGEDAELEVEATKKRRRKA